MFFHFSLITFISPRVYFYHGTMASGKTHGMIKTVNNLRSKNKKVFCTKSTVDTRSNDILSRTGQTMKVDFDMKNIDEIVTKADCIFIDEAQFLPAEMIDKLRWYSSKYDVDIYCYGLKVDYMANLFPATKRLIEVADYISEYKRPCSFCDRMATMNIKRCGDKVITSGEVVQIGFEELFLACCYQCYYEGTTTGILPKKREFSEIKGL